MLALFTKIGQTLYRIWFYVLAVVPILFCFPFLFLFTASERWYPQFFWLARNIWANTILYGMGCFPKISRQQRMERGKSYMLVANHTSMLDVMLMLKVSRNPFVFVGKRELVEIPIFGFFYKRVCIMVNREDSGSRSGVYRRANRRLNQGLSICIFPEGGVPEEEIILDTFKDGAFKMAIAHKIPIVPIVFLDNKKRYPFSFFSGAPGHVRAHVFPFFETRTLREEDKAQLRNQVRDVILEGLQAKEIRASYRT